MLRCRAAASNARNAFSGGSGLCMSFSQSSPEKTSFVIAGRQAQREFLSAGTDEHSSAI
jgi:hypothetical protein